MGRNPETCGTPGAVTTQGDSSTGKLAPASFEQGPVPGLLLAWKPSDIGASELARLQGTTTVGRSRDADWTVRDARLSKRHFEVSAGDRGWTLRDLGSTNGTYVNGRRLGGATALQDQDVVRAGRCLFVFAADLHPMTVAPEIAPSCHGMVGPFCAGAIARAIEDAVRTGRHLWLEGESGVGKELAARAVHRLVDPKAPFLPHNCAAFASAEEAETTLFGVMRGVFTGVEARTGLVEQAERGVLYLDEVPNLPLRVQRSLLRFAEGGEFVRIGDSTRRRSTARLVFGSNRPAAEAIADGSLARDLVVRAHRVEIPPLVRRRADIPAIFSAVLEDAMGRAGVDGDAWRPLLTADHVEAVLLRDFRDSNVRLLQDIAARTAVHLSRSPRGSWPRELSAVLAAQLADSPVVQRSMPPAAVETGRRPSVYEVNRAAIAAAYHACGGNLTDVERTLGEQGITVHRKWLAEFLERWGIRRRRRARG